MRPASSTAIGQPAGFVPGLSAKRTARPYCYRVDPSGRIDLVVSEDQVPDPNASRSRRTTRSCTFHLDRQGPGDTGPGGKGDMFVFDVGADNKLSNQKRFRRLHD